MSHQEMYDDPTVVAFDMADRICRMIRVERLRQQYVFGHTPQQDDDLIKHQLIDGAMAYAVHGIRHPLPWPFRDRTEAPGSSPAHKSRKVCLVIAAAMLVAEIERIEREEATLIVDDLEPTKPYVPKSAKEEFLDGGPNKPVTCSGDPASDGEYIGVRPEAKEVFTHKEGDTVWHETAPQLLCSHSKAEFDSGGAYCPDCGARGTFPGME